MNQQTVSDGERLLPRIAARYAAGARSGLGAILD